MDQRALTSGTAYSADAEETNAAARALAALLGSDGAVTRAVASSASSTRESISVEERALVSRARAGDQDAFGRLVQLHQRQVYALALRMLRDSEEASEATQEVFLAAWQALASFRGDARFTTWIYSIAFRHCLKVSEGKKRDSEARARLAAESALALRPSTLMSTQQAEAAERELRETVRAEIGHLPAKYRAVLVLRHMQDLSYEEMAEVMRLPIGTVKTQLFRARAMLRERLEELKGSRPEGLAEGIAQSFARAGELGAELGAGLRGILERRLDHPRRGDG